MYEVVQNMSKDDCAFRSIGKDVYEAPEFKRKHDSGEEQRTIGEERLKATTTSAQVPETLI